MKLVAMPATDTPDHGLGATASIPAEIRAAIDALAAEQGCDAADATRLLRYVDRTRVAARLLPDVMRRACERLTTLRSELHDPHTLSSDPDITSALARASDALRPDPAFSLDAADQALCEALAACAHHPSTHAETPAWLRARRADLAALGQNHPRAAERYAEAAASTGLSDAVRWRYAHARATVLDERGRDQGDNEALIQAIELYERNVLPLAPEAARPDDWSATQHALGQALGILAQRRRGIHLLERSVAAFRQALTARSRERSPLAWAATQHALGNALGILAQRQGDRDMLERAVAHLEQALSIYRRDQAARDWAMVHYQLGTALLTLGQLEHDSIRLARAIDAYRQALQVWTLERTPLDWARIQDSLATALRLHGEQGNDPRELEQAVNTCREALRVWNREHWPQEWGMAQNSLGAALHRLGERTDDVGCLSEAVASYRLALCEMRRQDNPIAWAMTTANLGDARRSLAERTRDAELCRQAIDDFEAVASVFREESHPPYYDLAKERLAVARKLAAELSA